MTTKPLHMFIGGALLAMAACQNDNPDPRESTPIDTADLITVGSAMIPTHGTTAYLTFSKLRDDRALERSPDKDVVLRYGGTRGAVELSGGIVGKPAAAPVILKGDRPSVRGDLPPGIVDLLELLPSETEQLALDRHFQSPPPDDDYVLQEADKDRLVLWQTMDNKPVAFVTGTGYTLARVENRAMNRLFMVDDDGSIQSADLGPAYVGVTDLVKVEGHGWEVLRFARVSDIDGADQRPSMTLDDARGRNHAAFVVCASSMAGLDGKALTEAHGQLLTDAPEFAKCVTR